MSDPWADVLPILMISVLAAVFLIPVVMDILALWGVGFAFRPTPRFTLKKPDAVSRFRFFTGILSLCVAASWVFAMGWLRILFGLFMVIHFVGFRIVSWWHLRNRASPLDGLLLSAWATFCLGYFFLGDFGDTDDSAIAFFGLVRHGPLFDVMMSAACVLLLANLVLLVVLIFTGRKPARLY